MNRRDFLVAGGALTALTALPRSHASWESSPRYPDPLIKIIDPAFARYRVSNAKVERLATGLRWGEGPVWFGDARCLLWSDIPNNRLMRWDEETGAVSVFRAPANHANGNTRDRQGRLLTCEHLTTPHHAHRIRRFPHRHRRPLRRQTPQLTQRPRLQVRRLDLVHRPAVRRARLLRG